MITTEYFGNCFGKVPIFITFSRFLFTFCNGVAHTLMITTEYFGNCFGLTNFR